MYSDNDTPCDELTAAMIDEILEEMREVAEDAFPQI